MYARVSRAMAQFFLKIAHLSFSMGPAPGLKMVFSYGLRPRLWLLMKLEVSIRPITSAFSVTSNSNTLSWTSVGLIVVASLEAWRQQRNGIS